MVLLRVLKRVHTTLRLQIPLSVSSAASKVLTGYASGLSGLDFPRYSGLLERLLFQAASVNGL